MHAATRSGYYWPTVCRGQGHCTQCFVEVESGSGQLSEPDGDELDVLERVAMMASGEVRLACQAQVFGDVIVTKPGVKLVEEREAS